MTGDEFKRILIPCYRQMYGVAVAILRNADDASDVVQDAMSVLWQRHEELGTQDNLKAYCCRVVRNLCIDRLRVDARRYFERIDSLYMIAADSAADSGASYTTMCKCISNMLMKFKEKQRRVLSLSIFSQLSSIEIIECDESGKSAQLQAKCEEILAKYPFELITEVSEDNENVKISGVFDKDGKTLSMLLIVTQEDGEMCYILMKGKIDLAMLNTAFSK